MILIALNIIQVDISTIKNCTLLKTDVTSCLLFFIVCRKMYDKKLLAELLAREEYKTVDNDGKILIPSNAIFNTISRAMSEAGSHMTAKHIYTTLKQNRNGVYDHVLRAFNINHDAINKSKDSTLEMSEYRDTNTQTFCLVISIKDWKTIKPRKKMYGDRKYLTLKAGKWSYIFAEEIWKQTNITCAFSFKYAKVYAQQDAKYYTNFVAKCNECTAKLKGYLYSKPRNTEDAIFECHLQDFQSLVLHTKKRQLKGDSRRDIAGKLIDSRKHASIWRAEEAERLMQFGGKVPPMLYDATVLRKAKQEEYDKQLNVKTNDPLINLRLSKYTCSSGIIRSLGFDPFYCMYWTEEQLLLYKSYNKQPNSYFAIDATGKIAKKIKLPEGQKSSHIFLYQCVCSNGTISIPVFQMTSCKHDAALITFFLLEILRSGASIPRIAVCDFSKAILIALSRVFARSADLSDYMQTCYNILILKVPQRKPSCYIRLDVNHVMAIVARWKCLKGKAPKVRQFFLRSMGHAYRMTSFKEVEHLLKSVLIVSMSQETGENENDTNVESEVHLQYVNTIIKGIEAEDLNADEENEFEWAQDSSTSWTNWAEHLIEDAKSIASKSYGGNTVNAFYIPEITQCMKILLTHLPLWTAIMKPVFATDENIATSSIVEAEFANLKCRAFDAQLPMRIDKFILRHIKYLQSKLILASQNILDGCCKEDIHSVSVKSNEGIYNYSIFTLIKTKLDNDITQLRSFSFLHQIANVFVR